jgi:type VI secretion system secreted protein Hcp
VVDLRRINIDGTKSGKVNIQGAWNLAKNTPNLT